MAIFASRVEMENHNSAWISPGVIVDLSPLERILRECLIWRGRQRRQRRPGQETRGNIGRIVGFLGSPKIHLCIIIFLPNENCLGHHVRNTLGLLGYLPLLKTQTSFKFLVA
jgi:hypothetical protein